MDEQIFEKIEGYIQGTLPPEEQKQFEAEMEKDAALSDEVAFQRKLIKSIETESVRQLLDQLHTENFEEEETPVVTMRQRQSYTWMAVAASVALLMVAGWWVFFGQQPSTSSLYAAYFSPATGLSTTLGYTNNAQFSEGMISYKLEEYAEAKNWWQPLLEADPANDTLNFYMGVASLANEQTDEAMQYLTKVEENQQSIYYGEARWYLALAYLQHDDKEKAKALLQELSAQDSDYQAQSLEILEKLE